MCSTAHLVQMTVRPKAAGSKQRLMASVMLTTPCCFPLPAADIILRPVAEMLNELLLPGVRVWFCMQGEMNLSVMNHPEQYLQLYTYLKNVMLKVSDASDAAAPAVDPGCGVTQAVLKPATLMLFVCHAAAIIHDV
jgi:hypothetical protein